MQPNPNWLQPNPNWLQPNPKPNPKPKPNPNPQPIPNPNPTPTPNPNPDKAAEHLRERPACGALLTQAAQAVASMVQHSCAADADARAAQARTHATGVG